MYLLLFTWILKQANIKKKRKTENTRDSYITQMKSKHFLCESYTSQINKTVNSSLHEPGIALSLSFKIQFYN